jgi:hypothetical protein
MPSLTLNVEQIAVESFATEAAAPAGTDVRPKTFEPGCSRDFCRAEQVL